MVPLLGFAMLCLAAVAGLALALRNPTDADKVRSALRPTVAPADIDYLFETQPVTLADTSTLNAFAQRLHQIGALSPGSTVVGYALWLEIAVVREELRTVRSRTFLATGIAVVGLLISLYGQLWPAG